MPSREFVERLLSTGSNDEPDFTPDEEPEAAVTEEEPEDDAPATTLPELPEEEEGGEEEEEQPVEPSEDEAEEQESPEAAQEEEDFYLANRYRTREEAEKGWLEKEQMISRLGEESAQMRQQIAEMQGYLQGVQQQQQYQQAPSQQEVVAWAEQHIEGGSAWGGASEALDLSLEAGDPRYIDTYIETWKEQDPYEASRFRVMVDSQVARAQEIQQAQAQPPPVQQTINTVWLEMASDDAELADPEIARQIGQILRDNPALKGAALSGHPGAIRGAIVAARDGYRLQAARPGNGTPRKVKASDAERLREDKLAATVTTGDSSPDRRESTPEVPPELQDMLSRIQAGEGGFPKLRE